MSLRYSFRHLFFGGKLRQKRLYKILEDLDASNSGDDTKIQAIETAIGKASGTGAGGILKDIKDINDGIGDVSEPAEGTILYRIAQLEAESQTTTNTEQNLQPEGN